VQVVVVFLRNYRPERRTPGKYPSILGMLRAVGRAGVSVLFFKNNIYIFQSVSVFIIFKSQSFFHSKQKLFHHLGHFRELGGGLKLSYLELGARCEPPRGTSKSWLDQGAGPTGFDPTSCSLVHILKTTVD
jgi:hypothetical protein